MTKDIGNLFWTSCSTLTSNMKIHNRHNIGDNVILGEGIISPALTDRKTLLNATIKNPIYLSKNILYSVAYAKGQNDKIAGVRGFIGHVRTKGINVFDFRSKDDFKRDFGNPDFAQLFEKTEPYFAFNTDVAFSKNGLQPVEFTVARSMFSVANGWKPRTYSKESVAVDNSKAPPEFAKMTARHMVIAPKGHTFTETLFSKDQRPVFSNVTHTSYSAFRDWWDETVFWPALVRDTTGNPVRDSSGAYRKTRYSDRFRITNQINADRPVSVSDELFSRDGNYFTPKLLEREMPSVLTDEQLAKVQLYMEFFAAVREKWSSLFPNSTPDSEYGKDTGRFVDRLQLALHMILAKVGYDGYACSETVGAKSFGVEGDDVTVCLWNGKKSKLTNIFTLGEITGWIRYGGLTVKSLPTDNAITAAVKSLIKIQNYRIQQLRINSERMSDPAIRAKNRLCSAKYAKSHRKTINARNRILCKDKWKDPSYKAHRAELRNRWFSAMTDEQRAEFMEKQRIYRKTYRANHIEKTREYSRQQYWRKRQDAQWREEQLRKQREWRKSHKEIASIRSHNTYVKHREQILARQKIYKRQCMARKQAKSAKAFIKQNGLENVECRSISSYQFKKFLEGRSAVNNSVMRRAKEGLEVSGLSPEIYYCIIVNYEKLFKKFIAEGELSHLVSI